MNFAAFTLGIEEEYMVMDPETRELRSHEQKIVEQSQKVIKDKVKAEMHQAVVEVGTQICANIEEAWADVRMLRKTIHEIAGNLGFSIGAAGTHPFSKWEKQLITDHPRYFELVNEMQDAARSNLIFGLHVHVGMENREMAIHIANSVRYFLPTSLPSAPTRRSGKEGIQVSNRSARKCSINSPNRHPRLFRQHRGIRQLHQAARQNQLHRQCEKVWWDLRVHPFFNTVEFRICDVPLTVRETITLAAIFQAVCVKIYKLRAQNLNFILYNRALINENKWRASRYGIDGNLIDFGKEMEVNTRALIYELLDFVDDVLDDLGTRDVVVKGTEEILTGGTGADKQLKVFEESGNDFTAVVDYIQSRFLA